MKISSAVVVPFHPPIFGDAPPREWTSTAFEEILSLSGQICVPESWGESAMASVRELAAPSELPAFADKWTKQPVWAKHRHICFEAQIEIDRDDVIDSLNAENPTHGLSDKILETIITQTAAETLSRSVGNVLLATQIGRPGVMYFGGRYAVSQEQRCWIDGGFGGGLSRIYELSKTQGWPPLPGVSVYDAYHWIGSITGIERGEPKGSAGRAVSAISRILMTSSTTQDDPADLMWCMVGLEALYGEGQTHLRQQLVEKTRIVLGSPDTYKKAVGKMYDFRSRFIHGDVDFPVGHSTSELDGTGFIEEVASSAELALAVLVATVQQLIMQSRYDFKFEYRLIPSNG